MALGMTGMAWRSYAPNFCDTQLDVEKMLFTAAASTRLAFMSRVAHTLICMCRSLEREASRTDMNATTKYKTMSPPPEVIKS